MANAVIVAFLVLYLRIFNTKLYSFQNLRLSLRFILKILQICALMFL